MRRPGAHLMSALSLAGLAFAVQGQSRPPSPPVDSTMIARGAYLTRAADCVGCHTARKGGAPFAGGFGLNSPFGTITSTNITPDPTYGIGKYSYDDFARALRQGVTPAGKNLYPAMPYPSFAKLTDEDVQALYAYMMHGVQPVASAPPPTRVPFPFNQRWMLTAWKALFLPTGVYQPRADRDTSWNRGAYLVQSLGHCGSCHTPRGPAYQERAYDERWPLFLSGSVNDDWYGPTLTNGRGSGLGRISENDLVSFMKTGHGAGMVVYGSMSDTVKESLQYLEDDDLHAIARYLKSLPPQNDTASFNADTPAKIERSSADGNYTAGQESIGAAVYTSFCAQCHQADGGGAALVYPALRGNPSVLVKDKTSIMRVVIEGAVSPQTLTGPPSQAMPAFSGKLTDAQIAQVLTFVRSAWGNDAEPVVATEVSQLRKRLERK